MLMKTLKGSGAGFGIILVLLFILSFIVVYTPFPYEMSGGAALGVMAVGMLAGGFISSVGMPGKGWLRGLVCGGLMLAVLIIIGLAVNGGGIIQAGLFKGIITAVVASAAGGILGINV